MEQSHAVQHSRGEYRANAARRLPVETEMFRLQRTDGAMPEEEILGSKLLRLTRRES